MLSRTSISPNLGQQFRWIRGQWQRPFPSPRDRVAPPTATPRRRRKSLPDRLKGADDSLSSRHRAIMLRSSLPRLPASRPTGTAVRFDDATKRFPPSPAQQPGGVSGPAYQQPVLGQPYPGVVRQETGPAHQAVAPAYKSQQVEGLVYVSGGPAHQSPELADQPPGVAYQRPVVACRPQQPYLTEMAQSETNLSIKSQERMYSVEAEQKEAWSSRMDYAPVWSRTMEAPTSRSEATLSFTQKPQTRGQPSSPASQIQTPPPRSPDDRSVGGAISSSPRPPTTPQQTMRPIEPPGVGPMGGALPALPRPPAAHQPIQRPAEPPRAGLAVRREAARQKKLAVLEKADSVDEDEFDMLVAINYKQLIDAPPTPTGSTLSPPVIGDPHRSPKLSPRLARRPSPAEQASPISAAPPTRGAPPSRQPHQQVQQTAGGRQESKTEEESEDELSK